MIRILPFIFGGLLLSLSVFPSRLPAEEGSPFFDGLVEVAEKSVNPVYAVCVIENGVPRTAYFQPATRCHNCYSVAKLFTVTMIGILEDRGIIDTEERVYPILKDYFPDGYDRRWEKVKVSDLIKHRAGFCGGFLDIDAQDMRTWGTDDFLALALARPMDNDPGTKSVYSDAVFYLLSRIITEKTGEKLDDLMIRELLQPLHFEEYAFSKCPFGYPMGATGLYLSTEDMAKLGQLYLQKGVFDGKRILSERFVEKAFERGFELYPSGPSGTAFSKGGMNGQFLYMNRATGRVVAIHSFNGNLDEMLDYIYANDK